MGHMTGDTDMVVATPLPWGPPRSAVVMTAPRPALEEERPMIARESSIQKAPAPAASMNVPYTTKRVTKETLTESGTPKIPSRVMYICPTILSRSYPLCAKGPGK
jgi:hypothetical protein